MSENKQHDRFTEGRKSATVQAGAEEKWKELGFPSQV